MFKSKAVFPRESPVWAFDQKGRGLERWIRRREDEIKRLTAAGRQFGKSLSVYDISSLYPTIMKTPINMMAALRKLDTKRWWRRFTG